MLPLPFKRANAVKGREGASGQPPQWSQDAMILSARAALRLTIKGGKLAGRVPPCARGAWPIPGAMNKRKRPSILGPANDVLDALVVRMPSSDGTMPQQ